jgi:hypothetical protein
MYITVTCPHCGVDICTKVDEKDYRTVNICCYGCYAVYLATPIPIASPMKKKNPVLYSFCFVGDPSCSILQEV